MLDRLQPYFPYYPYLLGGLLVAGAVLLLLAVFLLWRTRTASVWRTRHDAGKLGGRLLLVSLMWLGAVTVISGFSAAVIYALDLEDAFLPPSRPYGLRGVAVNALQTATPTQPREVEIVGLDTTVSGQNASVELRPRLTAPVDTIYVFIRYRGMDDNLPWTVRLTRNGEVMQEQSAVWRLGQRGQDFFPLEHEQGFPVGRYNLELRVSDETVARWQFFIDDR